MTLRLLALALVLSGCAGARYSVDPAGEPEDLAWANNLFASRATVVVLTDGTAYDATALRLEADTTTWIDPATQSLLAVPTSAVLEVERRDGNRSFRRIVRRGVVGGAIVSGTLFAVAGYESGGCLFLCGSEPPGMSDRLEGAAAFGAVGALGGAFYGMLYGGAVGLVSSPTERFEVDP